MPYANIFGHEHNHPAVRTCGPRHYCVSAERTSYQPISFDYIVKRMKESEVRE